MSKKLFFVAGERSGDLHASHLIKAVKAIDSSVKVDSFGGDLMKSAGSELHAHYKDYSVMGFAEVLSKIAVIRKYLKACKRAIEKTKPDAVVLVDFGGFNLKIAKFCHKHSIKVIYYIPPKVWAWNQKRVEKIKKYIDLCLLILPFEEDFFIQHGVKAEYVGNPVMEEINSFVPDKDWRASLELRDKQKVVAVLPGSRKQELERIAPTLALTIDNFPDCLFLLAKVDNLDEELYAPFLERQNVKLFSNKTYDILSIADAALVTSGTATLETALMNTPQVVVYKTNAITYQLAKSFIKVDHVSLVNLCMNSEVVKELLQSEANLENITGELQKILENGPDRDKILRAYEELTEMMDIPDIFSNTASRLMLEVYGENK